MRLLLVTFVALAMAACTTQDPSGDRAERINDPFEGSTAPSTPHGSTLTDRELDERFIRDRDFDSRHIYSVEDIYG